MKKVLIGCGVVAVLFVLSIAGCMALLMMASGDSQKEFYDAVATGDVKSVTALFRPELMKEIDEPVLAVWVKEFNAHLGAYKGMSKTNFSASSNVENGVRLFETKGTASFEKGTASSRLKYADGKIIAFNVDSDQLPKDFFKGPVSTDIYRERAKAFIEAALGGEIEAAYNMMHENLQKNVSLDDFAKMMDENRARAGALKSVKFKEEEGAQGPPYELKTFFEAECEKRTDRVLVRFEFTHVKGLLLGFTFGVK